MTRGTCVLGGCGLLWTVVACGGIAARPGDSGSSANTGSTPSGASPSFAGSSASRGGADNSGAGTNGYPLAGANAAVAGSSPNAGGTSNGAAGNSSSTGGGAGGSSGAMGSGAMGSGGFPVTPDPGSGSCVDFTPCGGDPVGDWLIDDLCITPLPPGLNAFCPAVVETVHITGTLSLGTDGSVTTAPIVNVHQVVPSSCVPELGGCGASAGQLSQCTPEADGSCICDTTNDQAPDASSRFVASDDHLWFVDAAAPSAFADTYYFCQMGNQLLMRGLNEGELFVYQLTRK